MTRIIVESKNYQDVVLIKELAERLKISYQILKTPESGETIKSTEDLLKAIRNGVDVSNFGDPSTWQKKVREDRNLHLS